MKNYLMDAFVIKLSALLDVENQISKSLPKVIKKVSNEVLKTMLTDHLDVTHGHIKRLESIFETIDKKPKKIKVEAVRGMVADTEWAIENAPDKSVLDSVIISAVSYVEHYEMAGYITASRWAAQLGFDKEADLLGTTLEEEVAAADGVAMLAEDTLDGQPVSE